VVPFAGADVLLTGVSASGAIGIVFIWGQIIPTPGTAWTDVDPSAINLWTPIEPEPPTVWTPVAA
jgi:hypothetical protein